MAEELHIRTDLRPGDLGRILELHGTVYARECGWNSVFEAYVAEGLAEFALRSDQRPQRLWVAELSGRLVGSIAVVGQPNRAARLRWFLLEPSVRGCGYGRQLLNLALGYCRELHVESVFLWTAAGLTASAHLYRSAGFRLTEERTHEKWGPQVTEQRFELRLC